ncbi:MAG TPA: SDR family oxidoreductase [Pyrinomonadaceae bacterium]
MTNVRPAAEFDENAIAVIGLAGRFPGARDVDQFWANLRDGVESITMRTPEESAALGVSEVMVNNPNFINSEGVLEDIDKFDAAFFGYNPREAEILDPQHRFFLECAWEALENAGYNPETYAKLIGVYAGVANPAYLYSNLLPNADLVQSLGFNQVLISNTSEFVTTRASYKLNLRGPSYVLLSACSTSLVAVHVACQSILNGECDIALAGGVNISPAQGRGYIYADGGVTAKDGRTRAFDASATGCVGGHGVGLVVLKQLDEAIADGDYIHAVIRASSINNDGSAKIGYTAPSVEGQARAIAEALSMSGVEAETIGYIETHGTATALGDPIEVAALTKAFTARTTKKNFCGLGSVKTNIGHLNTTAGIAGFIKAVLALKNKAIPPSLHYTEPNPQIDFENSPFYVNASLREWEANGSPRRAGVSSFGIGGTNAHIILEEAPPQAAPTESLSYQLLTISGRTPMALDEATDRLAVYLKQNPEVDLADVAYTGHIGRKAFAHRRTVVAANVNEAIAALEKSTSIPGSISETERRAVFMFPGQGVQYVNMARELYESIPAFRDSVDECAESARSLIGLDLRSILFAEPNDVEAVTRQLEQNSITPVALFAIEYSLARMLLTWGVKPVAMIGHSFGEYVAACLAGVFSPADGLRLVAERGRLVGTIDAGAMSSVQLPAAEVRAMLSPGLALASINSNSLCVVSGPTAEIAQLEEQLQQKEIPWRRLHIAHASHCALVEPVIETYLEVLRSIKFNPPTIPFISNVTGAWITAAEATDPHYWARHLRQTVQFADGLKELCKEKGTVLIELGPGRVLSSLVAQNSNGGPPPKAVSFLRHVTEAQSDVAVLMQAIGRMWQEGVTINWRSFYAPQQRQRLPLPTYPFERQRFWLEPRANQSTASTQTGVARKKANVADWFYVPSWKRSPLLQENSEPANDDCLVFAGDDDITSELVTAVSQNRRCVTVKSGERFEKLSDDSYSIDPRSAYDYQSLLQELRLQEFIPRQIVHLWNIAPTAEQGRYNGLYSLLFLTQAFTTNFPVETTRLFVVTTNVHEVTGAELPDPERAMLSGACRVVPQEHSNIRCRTIDIESTTRVDDLLREFEAETKETTIAYRGRYRWVQIFEATRTEEHELLKQRGVYLITGGLGNLGLIFAEELARSVQAKLVLAGRSQFPEKSKWPEWLTTHDESDRVSTKIRRLQELEELGAEILVVRADVANEDELQGVIDGALESFGHIDGVIHAAGIIGRATVKTIDEMTAQNCDEILRPKVEGLTVLEKVLRKVNPDFVLLMSSLSGILGGLGFMAHAAADNFMGAFASAHSQTRWLNVNWDGWQLNEQKVSSNMPGASLSQLGITPEEGLKVFRRVLSNLRTSQLAISTSDLQTRLERATIFESLLDQQTETQAANLYKRPELASTFIAPVTEVQQQIAAIWQTLLGIDQVGIHDNFFELGGHSLLAIQLTGRLRQDFKVEIPLRSLFEMPTIDALAAAVEREQSEDKAPSPYSLPIVAYQDKSIDELLKDLE